MRLLDIEFKPCLEYPKSWFSPQGPLIRHPTSWFFIIIKTQLGSEKPFIVAEFKPGPMTPSPSHSTRIVLGSPKASPGLRSQALGPLELSTAFFSSSFEGRMFHDSNILSEAAKDLNPESSINIFFCYDWSFGQMTFGLFLQKQTELESAQRSLPTNGTARGPVL